MAIVEESDAIACKPEASTSKEPQVVEKLVDASSAKAQLRLILHFGWPNSVNMFMALLPGFAMLSAMGADPQQQAACGMGWMFMQVTGTSIIMGFGSGAGPLISQAYGAANLRRCGDILQRQLAIHALLLVIVASIWLSAEEILVAFSQPASIAALVGKFLRWRIVGLPFRAFQEDVKDYLLAQRITHVPMLTSVCANFLNILLFRPFIEYFGFVGAPLAVTVAEVLHALVLFILTPLVLPNSDAWPRWSFRVAFSGWKEILFLAGPSTVMMLSEWWGWELNLFFAGWLCVGDQGCAELDVFPMASQTMVMAFMVHVGFSMAASTLVGNALGAGNAAQAWIASKVALLLAAVIAGLECFVLVALCGHWGHLFTDDDELISEVAKVLPLVAAYIFFDALGPGALINILRGMGIVKLPAVINFLSFYAVGIPFGLWLTFKHGWGVTGLWAGLLVGMLFMVFGLMLFLSRVDLHEVAELARNRALALPTDDLRKSSTQEAKAYGKQTYDRMATDESPAQSMHGQQGDVGTTSPRNLVGKTHGKLGYDRMNDDERDMKVSTNDEQQTYGLGVCCSASDTQSSRCVQGTDHVKSPNGEMA